MKLPENPVRTPTTEELGSLAEELGVTPESLTRIGVLWVEPVGLRRINAGFGDGPPPEHAWAFQERAGDRSAVGLSLRAPDGRKGFGKGMSRGLVVPEDLPVEGSEIFVVEGASDTAALLSMGLPVVGRPSNNAGAKDLELLLAGYQRVYVVGEYDPKPNGKWPGKEGAESVAWKLAARLDADVSWVLPPKGHKDVRSWLQTRRADGATDLGALGTELRDTLTAQANPVLASGLVITSLDTVESTPVEWLWKPYLPKNKFCLVVGDAGVGKSTLLADLIARVTTGRRVPDADDCFNAAEVLMFAAEDDKADTLKPRLEAADADCSRVKVVDSALDMKGERAFALPEDLRLLERELDANPSIGVVIIDPLLGYTGDSQINSHNVVRPITTALTRLAAERGITIIGVMHFNKNEDTSVGSRVLGAGAFQQAARAGLTVGIHPDDPDKRVMIPFKNNLARIDGGPVFELTDHPSGVAVVRWTGEMFDGEPEQVVKTGATSAQRVAKQEAARQFLLRVLASGPVEAKSIVDQAKGEGHSERTIERAAKDLGLNKSGGPGSTWSLPGDAA